MSGKKNRRASKKIRPLSRYEEKPTPTSLGVGSTDQVLLKTLRFFLTLIKYGVIFLLGGIVSVMIVGSMVVFLYLRTVATHANVSVPTLFSIGNTILSTSTTQNDSQRNILILGIDTVENRDSVNVLTDTIMLASINSDTARIHTVSFPRDLYIASNSAKINALYDQGKTLSPAEPDAVIKKTVEDISGIPIQNVVVLDLPTVGEIIDAFGGLDIEVERSFVDMRYPRGDVDVRVERNPNNLYEMVAFTKGIERMNGKRALQYIRSRHSTDPIEGTDDARVRRQQRVTAAMLSKVSDSMLIRNPEQVGKLLGIYQQHFAAELPLTDIGAIALRIAKQGEPPQIISHPIPVQANGQQGVIYHPLRHVSGAWVYLPVDPTYNTMKQSIQDWMKDTK